MYIIFSSPHRKSPMHTLITALSSWYRLFHGLLSPLHKAGIPSKVYQSLCISTPQRYTEQITNACTIWLFGRRLYGTKTYIFHNIGHLGAYSYMLLDRAEPHGVWKAACGDVWKKVIDFQSGDVIMIEKPYTLGKLKRCSQNVHIMFVACLDMFGYIISKESYVIPSSMISAGN